MVHRLREPKATALIFVTGSVVVTGTKSEAQAELAAKTVARGIKTALSNNKQIKFRDFAIQNMVGMATVGFAIRLEGIHYGFGQFCSYEPEVFPGLVYRMFSEQAGRKTVFLIFVSGKVVVTGAKSQEQMNRDFQKIYHAVLKKFEKPPAQGAGAAPGGSGGR